MNWLYVRNQRLKEGEERTGARQTSIEAGSEHLHYRIDRLIVFGLCCATTTTTTATTTLTSFSSSSAVVKVNWKLSSHCRLTVLRSEHLTTTTAKSPTAVHNNAKYANIMQTWLIEPFNRSETPERRHTHTGTLDTPVQQSMEGTNNGCFKYWLIWSSDWRPTPAPSFFVFSSLSMFPVDQQLRQQEQPNWKCTRPTECSSCWCPLSCLFLYSLSLLPLLCHCFSSFLSFSSQVLHCPPLTQCYCTVAVFSIVAQSAQYPASQSVSKANIRLSGLALLFSSLTSRHHHQLYHQQQQHHRR